MIAIRTVLSMASLLGVLALATPAAAEGVAPPVQDAQPPAGYPPPPGYAPPGYPPPGYAPPGYAPPGYAPPGYAPPGYPPPPGYAPTAPPVILGMPRTLPFKEREPPPEGYRLETQMSRRLVIAGTIVLGTAWALSALTAGSILAEGESGAGSYAPLLVPVGGPFITLATGEDIDFSSDDGRVAGSLVLLDGLTQVTGFALLVAGLVSNQQVWVRSDIPRKVSLHTPELLVGPTGGTLRVQF
ncbi:hypothetical protein WME75_29785 [Sorangium sp. So ce1014]|uniref:hypothetical protein n=1 Tax=Sorangium sp. So ce1014 TaxID=3133326 RepID=UPI003F6186F3